MPESRIRSVQYIREFPQLSEFFSVMDKRGQGTFASVFAVQSKTESKEGSDKSTYALKMLIPTVDVRRIENEVRILRRLGGRCNVIKMHTAWRIKDHVFILMPFVNFTPFADYYLSADEKEIIRYMRCLLAALSYIHKFGIIHRDIKPTNFLMDQRTKRLFLVDFGLAHSETYGDVDERWESECDAIEAKQKEANSINQQNKRSLPPNFKNDGHTKSAKTPRLERSNPEKSSPSAPSSADKQGPFTHPEQPAVQKTTCVYSVNKNFGKISTTQLSSSASLPSMVSSTCVCGFRLAVCKGCRALPRAVAARRGGTLGFRPPEVMMRCIDQTTAVDVWAAGVIFLSFVSGRYPFIKVDDDLDVLHAFTHLLSYERMNSGAKSLGRRILMDPKPPSMEATETPVSWLRERCIAIRRHEKKFAGLPPLLSGNPKTERDNVERARSSDPRANPIALPSTHVFSVAAYDLLTRLLEPSPLSRISAHDALRHPLFASTSKERVNGGSHLISRNNTSAGKGTSNGADSPLSLSVANFKPRPLFC